MLTKREFEQLKVAIDAMDCVDVIGRGIMVSAHNVKVILSRWVEEEESDDDGNRDSADSGQG